MLTAKELLEACQEQITKGNGDKQIIIWTGSKYEPLEKLFFDQTGLLLSVKPGDMHKDFLLNSIILG